jgi:hypothetical protein
MDYYFVSWPQKKGEIILQSTVDYDEKKIKTGEFVVGQPFPVKLFKLKGTNTMMYVILRILLIFLYQKGLEMF